MRRLRYKRGQPLLEEDAGGRAGASILQMDTVQSQRGAKRHHTPSDALFPVVSAETSGLDILWRSAGASGDRLFCREPPQGRGVKCSAPPATTLGAGAPEAGPICEPEGGRQFGDILRFLSVNPLDNLHGNADVALRRRGMRRRGPCDEVKCAVHPTSRGPWDDGLTDLLSGN